MKALGVLLVVVLAHGEIRFSLNSDRLIWTVRNANKSLSVEGRVPGGIYTDLQRAGVLSSNLFYRFNDIEYRWVARENWTYYTHFDLPVGLLNKTAVNLVLHGVDTIATVRLNGLLVASPQNMFVRYVIPIKEFVHETNNTLQIDFESPIVAARRLSESYNYTVPPKCVPAHYNGECHVNFLRKMQASFSWDWGPAFPSMGLWKPVEIEAFDSAVVRDVTFEFHTYNETMWRVNVTTYSEPAANQIGDFEVRARISAGRTVVNASSFQSSYQDGQMVSKAEMYLPKKSFNLWWPHGYGKQPLYDLAVTYRSETAGESGEKVIRVGLRKVELVQDRIRPPREGLTFYFRVNEVPIFAKGSNWIPSHILPELSYDEKRVRSLLLSASDANMNILRVWGGGLYESDLFYKIADELGIMIWQDMMYACSMYPTNEEFLKSVSTETVQQVRRLQHHASIVLWAGNNENEAALRGNWYGTSKKFQLYKSDYIKLYVDTVKPAVLANDKTRPFEVSSPSNGVMSEREGWVANDPYSPLYGDTHFYNYILDSWNSIIYPNTRFASEYGFQSLPSIKTMEEVTVPNDRRIESQFSAKREHLLAGYVLMALQMGCRLPSAKRENPEEYYRIFTYYSQISQAMGTKTETEKYRRDRNKLTKKNQGRTMGAMYWQLNDVWQAPTWSSIDFTGRWKMLHYYAKKFFSPVMVSPDLTIDKYLNVFVVSDLGKDIPQAELSISVYSWDDFEPKKVITTKEVIRSSRSKIHARYELPELLKDANCNVTNCFIYVALTAEQMNLHVDNILYPISLAKVTNLQPAHISVDVKPVEGENEIRIGLETNRIAPFVWLETDEPGQFSDNGFTLIQRNLTVRFGNRGERVDFDNFKKSLTVRSLLS